MPKNGIRYISGIIGLGVLAASGIFTYSFFRSNPEEKAVPTPSLASSPESPGDTVPTPTEAPHPVSFQALALRAPQGSAFSVGRVLEDAAEYTRYYITYKTGNLTISGIMNKPKGDGPFPILILNHGYIDPAVYTNGRGLRREQDYLVRQGYVVIHPDYRNHADSSKDPDNNRDFRMGYVEDVIDLVDALKESDLTYFKKDSIGMLGHSMGGGVTLGVLASKPDLVQAAVLFAPVSASAKENFDRYSAERQDLAQEISDTYGTPDSNPDFWKNVSVENFLGNITVPIMVHHGTADESTPLRWSESLVEKLKEEKKDVTFHVYPGEPHEFIGAWPQVMERTREFFRERL